MIERALKKAAKSRTFINILSFATQARRRRRDDTIVIELLKGLTQVSRGWFRHCVTLGSSKQPTEPSSLSRATCRAVILFAPSCSYFAQLPSYTYSILVQERRRFGLLGMLFFFFETTVYSIKPFLSFSFRHFKNL